MYHHGSVACRDRELRVWNLVKGKVTYHSKLAAEADLVNFHPSGNTVRVKPYNPLHRLAGAVEQMRRGVSLASTACCALRPSSTVAQ